MTTPIRLKPIGKEGGKRTGLAQRYSALLIPNTYL